MSVCLKAAAIAFMILASIRGLAYAQEDQWKTVTRHEDRYVTRFEQQQDVRYVSETTYRQQAYWKKSWNPLQKPKLEYRAVPTVKWVARRHERVLPITERQTRTYQQAIRVPTRPSTLLVRGPETGQTSGEYSTANRDVTAVASTGDTMPLEWSPRRSTPEVPTRIATRDLGGVAKFEDDLPRVGRAMSKILR